MRKFSQKFSLLTYSSLISITCCIFIRAKMSSINYAVFKKFDEVFELVWSLGYFKTIIFKGKRTGNIFKYFVKKVYSKINT